MKQLRISIKLTDRSDETLRHYLREIADIKPFTTEEETECAVKAFAGDKKAIKDLTEHNLRFVVSVAKQYATDKLLLPDLINEGNIGLVDAANKFDPSKGYKFISFAVWWIRKRIIEYITNHGRIVRLPANKINNIAKLEKQIHELEQKTGEKVDILEVINEYEKIDLNLDNDDEFDEYFFTESLSNISSESIDTPFGNDEDNTCLADLLMSDDKSTDYDLNEWNLKAEINSVLDDMLPRDKKIIESLFGLNGHRPMTLKEVGDEPEFALSRERVRQIRNKGLERLKQSPRIRSAFEMMG